MKITKTAALLVVICSICAASFVGISFLRVARQEDEIKSAACSALVAIKNGDAAEFRRHLNPESVTFLIAQKNSRVFRKQVEHARVKYGMDKVTEESIRASLRVVRDVQPSLVQSVLRVTHPRGYKKAWWEKLERGAIQTAVVRYNLGAHDMVSIMIKEDGVWTIESEPAYSARILHYESTEAASANNDAIEE